jgi:hypothetical protein
MRPEVNCAEPPTRLRPYTAFPIHSTPYVFRTVTHLTLLTLLKPLTVKKNTHLD